MAIYPRVSTAEQAESGHSIGEQIERAQKYCDAMGWQVAGVYTDAGFSGATLDRPGLKRLISDVKAHKVNKVLVYKLDRLSRSQKDTLYLIEDVFIANGCDFVSMTENFDTATPLGRAMIGILSVFAQLEREQIKERLSIGRDARAKMGKWHGGAMLPIGYDYQNGELVKNSDALQVKEAFERVLEGSNLYSIVMDFGKKGYTHKNGAWSDRTLRSVLKNPVYAGAITYKGNAYQGSHEPIISTADFEEVQRLISNIKPSTYKNDAQSFLTGFCVCGQCGAKYSYYSRKSEAKATFGHVRRYYACYSQRKVKPKLVKDPNCKNKRWEVEELEKLVFDEIRKIKIEPSAIQITDDSEIIKKELEKVESQLSKLMDLYTLGNLPLDLLQSKASTLNEKADKLKAALFDNQTTKKNRATKAEAIKLVESFDGILDSGSIAEVREVLKSLIDYIELDGDDVLIHWAF